MLLLFQGPNRIPLNSLHYKRKTPEYCSTHCFECNTCFFPHKDGQISCMCCLQVVFALKCIRNLHCASSRPAAPMRRVQSDSIKHAMDESIETDWRALTEVCVCVCVRSPWTLQKALLLVLIHILDLGGKNVLYY